MRPTGDEVLRGIQGSLLTYVLPELQSPYARSELMIISALLAIVAGEYDGAAQGLVDENAALRALAARGAEALDGDLAGELRALAGRQDASVRLSSLRETNEALRGAIARLGVAIEGDGSLAGLRAAVLDRLREEAEARSPALLGPRSDG